MTARHMLLAVGAVLVLGMAVYLVLEVGREPVIAQPDPDRAPSPRVAPAATPERTPPRARLADRPPRAAPEPQPAPEVTRAPAPTRVTPAFADRGNAKLDLVMSEANKAYDRGDFDEAKAIASKVLAQEPGNVRMLRILVSSDCIMGDVAEAQKHYVLLPPHDRNQMRTRCERYQVTLQEP